MANIGQMIRPITNFFKSAGTKKVFQAMQGKRTASIVKQSMGGYSKRAQKLIRNIGDDFYVNRETSRATGIHNVNKRMPITADHERFSKKYYVNMRKISKETKLPDAFIKESRSVMRSTKYSELPYTDPVLSKLSKKSANIKSVVGNTLGLTGIAVGGSAMLTLGMMRGASGQARQMLDERYSQNNMYAGSMMMGPRSGGMGFGATLGLSNALGRKRHGN